MQTYLAKYAGFCPGVRRAIGIAEEALESQEKWYSLGPLVHNEEVIDYFQQRGIAPVDDIDKIQSGSGIILRSHGVTPEMIEKAQKKGINVKDATCPRVKKIHDIVMQPGAEGTVTIIFGDRKHPEVLGILGWCSGHAMVVSGPKAAHEIDVHEKAVLVSQTTKDEAVFLQVADIIRGKIPQLEVYNTICPATRKRQQAARDLCKQVDLMLVIGSGSSSNTITLQEECLNTGVKTHRILNTGELKEEWFENVRKVGVTAGASTPDWIIKEVLGKMTEFEERVIDNQVGEAASNKPEAEESEDLFARMEAEMAEFETPARGDVIKGIVVQVLDDEVMVDVGGKSEGIIPLRELSVQDLNTAKEAVQVGDELEVMILKWDDDGTILLSKKKVDSQKVLDELEQVYNDGKNVSGRVIDVVKGGLLVDVGVIGFLPASHIEDGYVKNLHDYKDREFEFKIIEFNRNKRRGSQVVLSRRELVLAEKEKVKQEFWNGIEEGQTRNGRVKRIVDYGAFIDLGGYEGLLHVSELDHRRIEHPGDVLNEGDEIEVYVLGVDREKERVSLSRKKLLKSPWEIAMETYKEGDIIEGTVVRIAPFGAFVELDPGVDGLVHISQMANYRVEKPEDVVSVNQHVMVKILSIDVEEKRIGLSIKEAQKAEEQKEVEEYMEKQDDQEE